MDQGTLVTNQIDDGQKLVQHLVQQGFDVTVALWVKVNDDANWFLYISTRVVDDVGQREAYRRLNAAIHGMAADLWISRFEIKLIGANNALAKDAQEVLKRYPTRIPTRYRGAQLGGIPIDEAYIYPAMAGK